MLHSPRTYYINDFRSYVVVHEVKRLYYLRTSIPNNLYIHTYINVVTTINLA